MERATRGEIRLSFEIAATQFPRKVGGKYICVQAPNAIKVCC